jgi:hypothetical protein
MLKLRETTIRRNDNQSPGLGAESSFRLMKRMEKGASNNEERDGKKRRIRGFSSGCPAVLLTSCTKLSDNSTSGSSWSLSVDKSLKKGAG